MTPNPDRRSLRLRHPTLRRTTGRLLAALADSTPAFTPAPVPPSAKVWQRLLAALADSTPAFRKGAGTSEAVNARPPATESPASALYRFATEFTFLSASDRLMARNWYPTVELDNVHLHVKSIAARHEFSDEFPDQLASAALQTAGLVVELSKRQGKKKGNSILAIDEIRQALSRAQVATSALKTDTLGVLGPHGTRQLELASQELARAGVILEQIRLPSALDYVKDVLVEYTRTLAGQVRVLLGGNPHLQLALAGLQTALRRARAEIQLRAGEFAAAQGLPTTMIQALTHDLESEHLFDFSADVAAAVDLLTTAVADMTAANLTGVDLSGLRLTGVTWSTETQWPSNWEDAIHARSAEIGPNLYRIVDPPEIDTTKKADALV